MQTKRIFPSGWHSPFVASEHHPARLLRHYLIHSCLYYEKDTSLISDYEFDQLAAGLLLIFDSFEHSHKALIDRASLARTSSGFYIKYPSRIRGAAEWLLSYYKTNNKLPLL